MDQIAAALGCPRLAVQVDAAELRQAAGDTAGGRATLLPFATEEGERAWLDEAQTYGGTSLVGDRWVVVSAGTLLESLQRRLGGRIERSQPHSH
ncbi:hypothetical protein [Nonomuraea rubra]|uniref:Uncharacterized protein n=2 Tax=Nonomuraea rubra TaxID=46180 RepID=A0A7X0P192_9ACTN|nr:hypothetical protein [Nonomuraea rubra]MBB6553234.1 hypothetical protein [Nonomuraea rubra]